MTSTCQPLILALTAAQHTAYSQALLSRRPGRLSLAQALIREDLQSIGLPRREGEPLEERVVGCSTRELTALTFRAQRAGLSLQRYLRYTLFTPDLPALPEPPEPAEPDSSPQIPMKVRFTQGEWTALSGAFNLPDADVLIGEVIDQVVEPLTAGDEKPITQRTIYLSEREAEVIIYLAATAGMGLTTYLRAAVFGMESDRIEPRKAMVSLAITDAEREAYAASHFLGYGSTKAMVRDLIAGRLPCLDIDPDEGKETRFILALTPDELNMINFRAEEMGLSARSFVRRSIFGTF